MSDQPSDTSEENEPDDSGRPPSQDPAAERPKDTSVLPKATMPVELPVAPANPAAAGQPEEAATPEQNASADAPAEVPAEHAAPPSPGEAPRRGFGAWLGSLNGMEKFSCALILFGVLAFCALVFVPALLDFPEETELTQADDFPLQGKLVEVTRADTYWRKPVMDGADADTVRAGTLLIPILEIEMAGKGRVRIIFRDSEGNAVGDPVVHDAGAQESWSAACTAGLGERGDFTAYQTGELEPWSVELHEIAGDAGVDENSLLFKMNISPTLK